MPTIKLRPHIEPQHIPDSKQSPKSIRESEISGLCVGIYANAYHNDILKVTVGSMGGLGRVLNVARNCYVQEIMDAVILFSSIAVEYAINMDTRMQKEKTLNPKGWLNLNHDTLETANNMKLPIMKLLNSNESIKKTKIKFLDRRNQIAHGEYRDYLGSITVNSDVGFAVRLGDYIDIPKEDALDQFKKCSTFIIEWINNNPNVSNLTIEKL